MCRDELRALEDATNEKAAEGAENIRRLMQHLQVRIQAAAQMSPGRCRNQYLDAQGHQPLHMTSEEQQDEMKAMSLYA